MENPALGWGAVLHRQPTRTDLKGQFILIHSYPWYPADWRSSEAVLAMSAEERGIYRELLDHVWEHGSAPLDEVVLMRIARVSEREWKRSWPKIKSCFVQIENRLHSPKVDEKRNSLVKWHDARRDAGAKGAAKRWAKLSDSYSDSTAIAELKPSTPSSTPSTSSTSTTTSVPSSEVTPSSSTFWSDGQRENPKNGTTTDGNYATDKDALVALMCSTLGHQPEVRVVRDVCDALEIRGEPISSYLSDIRPRIKRLRLPPGEGFFLKMARNGTVLASEPETVQAKATRTGPCVKCKNVGMLAGEYCDCRMGKELMRTETRIKAEREQKGAVNGSAQGNLAS